MALEDLTLYVAQRADKERAAVVRELGAPVDSVKSKLVEVEDNLAGFQRTMHLVLGEVDADRERSAAIKVSEIVESMSTTVVIRLLVKHLRENGCTTVCVIVPLLGLFGPSLGA